jgi:hypothetical protein
VFLVTFHLSLRSIIAAGSTTAIGDYPANDDRRSKVPIFARKRGSAEPDGAVAVQLMKPWEPPMQSKLVAENAGRRTFVMVLDPDKEAFQTISDFAAKEGFSAASLTALGAFSTATVGWFDLAGKTYRKIPIEQQCEVLSALGDIAIDDRGKPSFARSCRTRLERRHNPRRPSSRRVSAADAGSNAG